MGKIYTADGWVNWEYIMNQPESIITVVGARGTGKTYGLFKWFLEHNKPFIYMRRLRSQLEECKKPVGNPFKKVSADLGLDVVPYSSAGTVEFKKTDKAGDLVSVGVALSVVANLRGVDYSEFDYILFDEFIASDGERPIKNEFLAFLNFYETVNRNREIEGKSPVKCIMLGNANRLNNPYFSGWKCTKQSLKMLLGNQMVWRKEDKSRMLILLLNSPISEQKKDTVLYQNSTDAFVRMAIDNAFRTDETNIKSEPLKEFNHIVSIGEIGIYKHKAERRYYVSETVNNSVYYEDFGISLKMFLEDYYMLRIYYMVNKIFTFESFECELMFRNIFNIA